MSKVIRPLASYKKLNPELYNIYLSLMDSKSLKGKENDFYFFYCNFNLGKNGPDSFFYNSERMCTNKGTVSEIGRLLLYGWYYNIESWSIEIGGYIYNAYKKIESSGETFNDLDFKKAVKHIRENIKYYYQNDPELKLYILETFFNNKLQKLLPEKPKELKEHDNAIEFLERLRIVQTKKGIDYWINRAEDFETYISYLNSYLEETYENYNFEFLNFEDWKKENKQYDNEYFNRVDKLDKNYKASYKDIIKKINLPKAIGYNK